MHAAPSVGEAAQRPRANAIDRLGPDHDPLKSYTRLKLSIAGLLRRLRDASGKRGSELRKRQCEELMVKLAEDRFTLAVLGQFKRGKSSLMNAIIGRELLPTGVLPLTSAITVLRFGPRERLVVEREGLQWAEVAPISRLEDYVTERANPGNRKKVKSAAVEVPLPFLRRGLEFVDTPGVGSAIAANTATAYAFVPACDAALFVTSVDSPLTAAELDFLKEIRRYVRKIFFVVNKTDLLGSRESAEVLAFVADTIREHLGTDAIRIFPLSCKLGLAAKAAGDGDAYSGSGLKGLEDELGRFLSDEKSAGFLAAIIDRALRLVEAEANEALLAGRARALSQSTLQQRLNAIRHEWQRLAGPRHDIFQKIRRHVLAQVRNALSPDIELFLAAQRKNVPYRLRRLLERAAWQTCASLAERITTAEFRRFHRKALRWLSERTEGMTFASDSSCRALWDELQTNLGQITNCAASALGLTDSPNSAADSCPPWRVEGRLDPRLVNAESHWQARLPPWLKPLPARTARSWLAQRLGAEHDRLIQSCKEPLLSAVENQFRAALDRLWERIDSSATEIESRVLARLQSPQVQEFGEAAMDSIRQKLLALQEEVIRLPTGTVAEEPAPSVDTASTSRAVEPTSAPLPEPDFGRDLRTRGCPVCDHLFQVMFRFFSHWQYDLGIDEKAQARFAAESGFCPLHAWQLEALSSHIGSSVAYPRLAERIARVLSEAARSPDAQPRVRELLRDSRTCRACRLLRDAERSYAERLALFLNESRNRAAYAGAQGVCLRHLALVTAAPASSDLVSFLLLHAAHRFEEMAEDMQAFAMKTDALRRALRNQDEEDAYWRAITHIVGAKSISAPWQEEIIIGG